MSKLKLVCIGDSLTAGYGVEESKRWSNLLSNELSIEVINSGISGDTTAGMLARFNEMVVQHKPSHVIITGGTNDASMNLPENLIISNILSMTRYGKFHGINSIIGIPTPFYNTRNITEDNIFISNENLEIRIKSFQKNLKKFALNDNQYKIDFSLNMEPVYFLDDGLHPNEKGHENMMKIAKQKLKEILGI